MMRSTDTSVMADTAATYERLATVLTSATDTQWDHASLCRGWRVREVVAHLTMPARYDDELEQAVHDVDVDFTALSDRIAHRDARLPIGELVGQLRASELHRWQPAGGELGALTHVVVHSLDVTVPLGLPPVASDRALRTVLDSLVGGVHRSFGVSIHGTRFEASDLEWAHGAGPSLSRRAADLVLLFTGRFVA